MSVENAFCCTRARFGATFLNEMRLFQCPSQYIDHCLRLAYVPQNGLSRLSAANHEREASPPIKNESEKDSDINAQNEEGMTSLMLASQDGNQDKVKMLIKRGASADVNDKEKKTAIHWAATHKNGLKCVKLLLDHSKILLQSQDIFQQSITHIAAIHGHISILQHVAKKGCSLAARDVIGCCALHWASFMNQVDCVRFLLSQKYGDSGLNCKDKSGALPIHYAAVQGNSNIVTMLTEKLNQLHEVDANGFSPLAWALFSESVESVEMMIALGANVSFQDSKGRAILHLAAQLGLSPVCQVLTSHGANIHAADKSQSIPLLLASKHGHAHTTDYLIQCGSSTIATDDKHRTAVHLAARSGHADVVKLLLDSGAERDASDINSARAIQLAAESGRTEVIRLLLQRGADAHVIGPDGRNLLHKAAANGFTESCRILVAAGVSVNAVDKSMKRLTPFDLALMGKHKSCVDFLTSCGGHTTGHFYRSASLIQAWWKFKRSEHREGIAREHATLVLQCSARQLLARVHARRMKDLQKRVENRAACLIQKHWKAYIAQKRRYEASYAMLKAKLAKEREKALVALKLIREQEHSSVVPPINIPSGYYPKRRLVIAPSPPMRNASDESQVFEGAKCPPLVEEEKKETAKVEEVAETPPPPPPSPRKEVKLPEIESSQMSFVSKSKKFNGRERGIVATLEKQNSTLLQSVMERDREIQRLREENRRLSSLQQFQARELAVIRERVQVKQMTIDLSPPLTGRATQLHSGETSVSNTSLHSFVAANAKRRQQVERKSQKAKRNERKESEHKLRIDQYKERCEELRRVIQTIKEMQTMLKSQNGRQAMKESRAELKEKIKAALEDVIRLRSEIDAMESQIKC